MTIKPKQIRRFRTLARRTADARAQLLQKAKAGLKKYLADNLHFKTAKRLLNQLLQSSWEIAKLQKKLIGELHFSNLSKK